MGLLAEKLRAELEELLEAGEAVPDDFGHQSAAERIPAAMPVAHGHPQHHEDNSLLPLSPAAASADGRAAALAAAAFTSSSAGRRIAAADSRRDHRRDHLNSGDGTGA